MRLLVDGIPADEAAIIHRNAFDVRFDGGIISAGDWVVWVPLDSHTDCTNTLAFSLPVAVSNDQTRTLDHGGLVTFKDGETHVDVVLKAEYDGLVDPTPFDGYQVSLQDSPRTLVYRVLSLTVAHFSSPSRYRT